ncbi:hypothetical protein TFLX_04887 [Thermoflexales bacterium]|nr:hypothetical protein TFLX_04887 [Thermoflexales bacterium]
MPPSDTIIAQRFVQLALALEQHLPGYVDTYFGPPEWKEQSIATGPRPIDQLAQEAADLAAAIKQEPTFDDQRRDYLGRQVTAMQTSLRLLQGEPLPLVEEVTLLYDITPTWVDEREFDEAHRRLDELLPPGDSLFERLSQHKQSIEITYAQAEPLLSIITERLRQLTRARFPLPDEESFELYPVTNQPWRAYNWYLGHGQSRIDINTDLPLHITDLATTLAHEGYAGHHTELSIKEVRLLQAQGRPEHCLALINSPACVVAEGIAVQALDVLLSEEEQIRWHAEEIFPRAGYLHLDAVREHAIDRVMRELGSVWDNAAFLLHEQHQSTAEVSAYFQRYGLHRESEADKAVEFISDPVSRSYIFTYGYGGKLLDALFAAKGNAVQWFTRLLTEPVTPSQIRAWLTP